MFVFNAVAYSPCIGSRVHHYDKTTYDAGKVAIQHCHHACQFQKVCLNEPNRANISNDVHTHVSTVMLETELSESPLHQMRHNSPKYIYIYIYIYIIYVQNFLSSIHVGATAVACPFQHRWNRVVTDKCSINKLLS